MPWSSCAAGPGVGPRRRSGRCVGRLGEQTHAAEALAGWIGWLRQSPACNGRVGTLGYCLGGDIAWVGACMQGFDSAVCYYGGAIAKLLMHTNKCPVMLHNGTADPWIPPEDEAKIDAILDKLP